MLAAASLTAVAGTLGATTACSRVSTAGTGNGGELLERLRAQGTVRLGIGGEPPLSYIDKNGELAGCDPAIAQTIFKRLGVPRVQPLPIEFNALIAGLNSQQFDVIAAGMYINRKRCDQVLFADPHYQMRDEFIVPRGNPKRLRTYDDVAERGAKLATVVGYAEIGFANRAGIKTRDMLLQHDPLSGLLAVKQGRADAFSTTKVTIRNVFRQAGSTKVEYAEPFNPLGPHSHLPGGGFAFRKTETKLRNAFNDELQAMKRSGELLRLMRQFGFTREEISSRSAKELCR